MIALFCFVLWRKRCILNFSCLHFHLDQILDLGGLRCPPTNFIEDMCVWGRSQGKWNCGTDIFSALYTFYPICQSESVAQNIVSNCLRHLFICQWDQAFRYSRKSFPLKKGTKNCYFRIDTRWKKMVEWIYELNNVCRTSQAANLYVQKGVARARPSKETQRTFYWNSNMIRNISRSYKVYYKSFRLRKKGSQCLYLEW